MTEGKQRGQFGSKRLRIFSKKVVPSVVNVLLSHWKLPLVWFVGGVSCANAVSDKAAGERWPNAFFAKQGLFSLKHAHEAPSASKVMCHRKSYTSNHRGEAVPDSPRMQGRRARR